MSPTDDWRIGEVIKSATEKQVGFKWNFFVAFGTYVLITIALTVIQELTVGTGDSVPAALVELLVSLIMLPLGIGLGLLGIRRAAGKATPVSTLWEPYSDAIPIIVMFIMMTVLIVAGFFLLVLPGIYLAIAYSFAPYLIIEKKMGAWEALETSRKAITQYWWRYFGLMLLATLLFIVGSIPILIGLVWILPILGIATGEVFTKTFGADDGESLELEVD